MHWTALNGKAYSANKKKDLKSAKNSVMDKTSEMLIKWAFPRLFHAVCPYYFM